MNPVTRVIALLVWTLPLLLTVDILSAGMAAAIAVCFFPLCGLRTLLKRSLPIFLVAPIAAVSMILYARPGGQEYVHFLSATISDRSLVMGAAVWLRILALGLPAVALLARVDPTDLGDGLAQILHLPQRFVIGAVAGTRMVSLFQQDWMYLSQARRSRGLGDHGRLRGWVSMSFSVLVFSLRRSSKLATAMEARGFGGMTRRTWARISALSWKDSAIILGFFLLSASCVAVSIAWGTFSFLGTT